MFHVPSAHVPIGTCDDTWYYSSLWPGIDGYASSDVLQGGVEADAICDGGTTTSYYTAWIEWYPISEVAVSSPVVQSGDLLYVIVWSTSSTSGYVYFDDITTSVTATYSITAPQGTTLQGESVEWITERPGINGGLANLMNYVDASWVLGVAWNYKSGTPTYQYIGQAAGSLTLDAITMLDNSSNPISLPYIENSDFLWMKDTGSALQAITHHSRAN
jgi:hypothetical protein